VRSSIITSISGVVLTEVEKEILHHPNIAGVILFAYNFQDYQQLLSLTTAIKTINANLTISVDHEGGRVWRFKDENFTPIPAMNTLQEVLKKDKNKAIATAFAYGETIAKDLKKAYIDFSYTPVLDINYNNSTVIGDRAFADNPDDIITLASNFIDGVHTQKMPVVAKHFPGHGFAVADSHLELPIDNRDKQEIDSDILPYKSLIHKLDYIMSAHIRYPKVDENPASFSRIWLKDILRNELKFKGKVISDDLSMAGAKIYPDITNRVKYALKSGSDMVLICNDISATLEVLENM
jgi:beta-N-acetylhexosaminidase